MKSEKHGQYGTKLYRTWTAMKTRCNNPHHQRFEDYGGRGIRVCLAWRKFSRFYAWAMASGYKPDLTLDRRDNNKGYSPSNCRWVTYPQQLRNRRRWAGTSKYRGVHWNQKAQRWVAIVTNNNRNEYLGGFTDEKQAAIARDQRAFQLFGHDTILNFPRLAKVA